MNLLFMKNLLLVFLSLVAGGLFLTDRQIYAQTNGTLTFSVLSASTGAYSPKHCIAIWIEKSDGTFIKTKLRRAQSRIQYLNTWISKSGQNVVDATTSATINSHQTETITWNCTDAGGNQVADGNYKIWMQIAWQNSNGPTYSVEFTKGPAAQHLTPADHANFKNIVLDWSPSNIGLDELSGDKGMGLYPNPGSDKIYFRFNSIECENAILRVFNDNGQIVMEGTLDLLPSMLLPLNIKELPKGVYFVKVEAGNNVFNEKLVISR